MDGALFSDKTHLRIDALRAMLKGRQALSGQLLLPWKRLSHLEGALTFTRYRLFCGGLATGEIDGTLRMHPLPDESATLVTGEIRLPHTDVQLPGATPGRVIIPQIKTITEADRRRAARAALQAATTAPVSGVPHLDIDLLAPSQVFVRGRGLDAEFGGKIRLTGTAAQPVAEGLFESRRGSFTFLDRSLSLTSASIRFSGPMPPSPFLDIQATTLVKDTTITVGLTGSAAKPELAFTSDPPQPKDELLALLLFGRQLSGLSPFQVAQLAQSLAELSGQGGSGPGALDRVRSFLGVDALNVGASGSNNDVTVGTGKYITDKVYVGVTQGAKPESREVTTEVEVYPHLSANTAIGASGQQSLGVSWKYDY
jgi:translocation and assembly module TamB